MDDVADRSGLAAPPPGPTVGEWMHPGLVGCPPDTAVSEMVDLMRVHGVHSLAVREGAPGEARTPGAAAQPVQGLVDDFACLLALQERRPEATAGELASPYLTIAAGASLEEAALLLVSKRARRALVMSEMGGSPLGVISISDLVRYLAQ